MRILLVEDDHKIVSFVKKGLQESGFAVDHAPDGEEGLHMALKESYDVMIIDLMLPKRDGLSLIETLRLQKVTTPIIILSAKRSVEERVIGLQKGSDDYMVKPFAFTELLARIRALLRRGTSNVNSYSLQVGELYLDRLTYTVKRGEADIELKPKEFDILEYMMKHSGQVVTRTMLMEHVWNFQFDPSTNVVDVHMCRLRDKIDKKFAHKMIHTIRGVGYVIKE
ncbi:response regulator transcription factor [Candidatus Uabimicrobium amorphum]|uniref:DNA-binding response regulator n=1 Tax=Uabimicrobium amorphum TaxID=2596890 RepID=A0A5S9IM79_UABAM|nr:response regulator transcription factor [Candidatus Uabimicrobium amorphum]BBM83921.1 DNA-binding response regulator [Candidatus Uabimicrobium amorphum]